MFPLFWPPWLVDSLPLMVLVVWLSVVSWPSYNWTVPSTDLLLRSLNNWILFLWHLPVLTVSLTFWTNQKKLTKVRSLWSITNWLMVRWLWQTRKPISGLGNTHVQMAATNWSSWSEMWSSKTLISLTMVRNKSFMTLISMQTRGKR